MTAALLSSAQTNPIKEQSKQKLGGRGERDGERGIEREGEREEESGRELNHGRAGASTIYLKNE